MKFEPDPGAITTDQREDFEAACSAEFSQGCIEPDGQG
jgi:hypothetical protein